MTDWIAKIYCLFNGHDWEHIEDDHTGAPISRTCTDCRRKEKAIVKWKKA